MKVKTLMNFGLWWVSQLQQLEYPLQEQTESVELLNKKMENGTGVEEQLSLEETSEKGASL